MTFGFQSAVDIATDTIDRIHTTATSHSRVFIIEVMGHKVGHVTLHAGIAGGADVILLPEIPYDIDVVTDVIQKRAAADKNVYDHCGCRRCNLKRRCQAEEKMNIKKSLQNGNIRPSPTNWQRRSSRRQTRK